MKLKRPLVYLVTFSYDQFLWSDGRPMYPPVAALYLATALRKAGCEPRVLHLLPSHLEQLKKEMEIERPSWIGFSVLTSPSLYPTLEASKHAKKLKIPVVWGGVHASILPEMCLSEAADYVVVGEAEETIMELATALRDGSDPTEIAGVVSSINTKFNYGPARKPLDDLDLFPPAWDMIDPNQYVDHGYPGGVMPFLFTRGCPYRCHFCYNQSIGSRRWRRHSDDYLSDVLDYFKQHTSFSILDFIGDDFLFDTNCESTSWIELLMRRGLKWAGSMRAGTLTSQFARWLEDHGCVKLRIGMESGHQSTLDGLNKKITIEEIYRATHALATTKIEVIAMFVINWPGETRESILSTLRLSDELRKINPRMRISIGLYIPMPGNPTYLEALDDGFQEPKSTEEWIGLYEHPYYRRGFTRREIEAFHLILARFYRFSFKPWPMQNIIEPVMRWRWRNGYFRWFAVGALRRWFKSSLKFLSESPISESNNWKNPFK